MTDFEVSPIGTKSELEKLKEFASAVKDVLKDGDLFTLAELVDNLETWYQARDMYQVESNNGTT